jgi:hypothetical protein
MRITIPRQRFARALWPLALGTAVAFTTPMPAFAVSVPLETGGQLAATCAAFLRKTPRDLEDVTLKRDACRDYLTGFVEANADGRQTVLSSEIEGEGSLGQPAERMACFRMPDYLSFAGFARLVVDFTASNPDYRTKPAYATAAASLASRFPCK